MGAHNKKKEWIILIEGNCYEKRENKKKEWE
jgi:hypothetical protein